MVLADKNITTLKLNVCIAFQIKKSDIQCKSKPAYLYFFQFLHLDNFIQVMDIHKRMGNIESFNTLIFFFSWLLCLFGETKYLCSFQNLKKLQLLEPLFHHYRLQFIVFAENIQPRKTAFFTCLVTSESCLFYKYVETNHFSIFIKVHSQVSSYPPVPLGKPLQQAIHLSHRKILQPLTLKTVKT